MDNTLKIRQKSFDKLLNRGQRKNEKNWEMLCSSQFPLVPFIGAGMSAWCYKTWSRLLKDIVAENYSAMCADIVDKALNCTEKPDFKDAANKSNFHWMEEIAECIFDDNEEDYKKNVEKFVLKNKTSTKTADSILRQLRYYVGNEGINKKSAAVKALYREFDSELMNEHGRVPEYQSYFHRLFKGVLITTNYDRALEKCYPSLFSYSYRDLNQSVQNLNANNEDKESWLYQAVIAKISQMKSQLERNDLTPDEGVTVPDVPMLLKVHGSIEQASSIALSRKGYDEAYQGVMPKLLREIFKSTTIIFLGYSLGEDRILDELKKAKDESEKNSSIKFPPHFAFLSRKWEEEDDKKFAEVLEKKYGVYPIFYDEDIMPVEMCNNQMERKVYFHDYCLGLLMENLLRRKMYYPQPPEMLWDKFRYDNLTATELVNQSKMSIIEKRDSSYVRREEAQQIWNLLNTSDDCPLIAITGEHGSGRSTLCKSLIEFQEGSRETLQFFYISLEYCRSWDEICIQLFQSMNIVEPIIPPQTDWKTVAEKVNERCGGYWRSVLILEGIDGLKDQKIFPQLWNVFKEMLNYWKNHQTRVIFICHEYPEDIPCYVWHIGELKNTDAKEVFFSACISGRYREISYLEDKVINKLVGKQDFRASTIEQLGIYANSKGDLTSLFEEWEYYYRPGDDGEQTVTRILWNYLLDEHNFSEKRESEQINIIKNILWIWGLLGEYPGNFPVEFLNTFLENNVDKTQYQDPDLSRKTLRYMKNIGLCIETEEEKEVILLNNMVECVEEFFLKPLSNGNEAMNQLYKNFTDRIDDEKKSYGSNGLRNFRIYTMQPSQYELRTYAIKEAEKFIENTIHPDDDLKNDNYINPEKAIIEVLDSLGEKVKNDEGRMKNRKLNLVLHYEIKSIIRFLMHCILSSEEKEELEEAILKIGYNFSHFYHYAPQHAFMLVKQLLEAYSQSHNTILYKVAGMNRVMGDIQRLLGRKDDAVQYYNKAIKLCNECLIKNFKSTNGDNENGDRKECLRIKAGVLLIQNYSKNSIDEIVASMKRAYDLYLKIEDKWGEAYYNQRIGELYALSYTSNKGGKTRDNLLNVIKYYNAASELYANHRDKTGNAYILKCMGDLVTEFNNIWGKDNSQYFFLEEQKVCSKEEEYIYFLVKSEEEIDENGRARYSNGWLYDAVRCYIEAFCCYYSHINWRGFANVIQAMETCARTSGQGNDEKYIINVERMYGLAEECYRWLGDIKGLADTLDYYGHAYQYASEGKGITEKQNYKYKARSKWAESELILEKLGDEKRLNKIVEKLRSLDK